MPEHHQDPGRDARVLARIARINRGERPQARELGHAPEPCPRTGCGCDHRPPCIAGWIDNPDAFEIEGYDSVRPCPVCRPEAKRLLDHDRPGHRLRTRKDP